jgi:hypothetical protein
VRRHPVERRQDAGEGTGEAFNVVGHHRQRNGGEARRIAVGAENEAGALRRHPRDHALQDGAAADHAGRLVAAAHAPGEPAGEHDAERCWGAVRHSVLDAAEQFDRHPHSI